MSDTWSQSKTQAGWIGRRDIKNVTFYGEAIYEDLPVLLNAPTKPTHATNKDYVDSAIRRISIGATTSPVYVDNGDGTLTIQPLTINYFTSSDHSGDALTATLPETTVGPFTDGGQETVVIRYEETGLVYTLVSGDTSVINNSNVIPIVIVWRVGNELHTRDFDALGAGLANKLQSSIINTKPYAIGSGGGMVISENANRTIQLTSATVYAGAVKIPVATFDSATDRMTLVYHVGGVWTYANNTSYNNTQYDNGTDLVAISNQKYAVRWYYRSIGDDKQLFYVLGSAGNYNDASAAALEPPRQDLPIILKNHCILVGRSVIQLNAATGITTSVFETTFRDQATITHNATLYIQGGLPDEYYHLTASQHTAVSTLDTTYARLDGAAFTGVVTFAKNANFITSSGANTTYWQIGTSNILDTAFLLQSRAGETILVTGSKTDSNFEACYVRIHDRHTKIKRIHYVIAADIVTWYATCDAWANLLTVANIGRRFNVNISSIASIPVEAVEVLNSAGTGLGLNADLLRGIAASATGLALLGAADATAARTAIDAISSSQLATKLDLAGGTITGDLTIGTGVGQKILKLYNEPIATNMASRIEFRDADGQHVQLRHNTYDTTRAPFGLHIEKTADNVESTLSAYLDVEGKIYSENSLVLHAANYNSYALPLAGGTITGTLTTQKGIGLQGGTENLPLRIMMPGGAATNNKSSVKTGAIKITLPQSWTSTMMRMTVRIYEYVTGRSCDIVIAGYNYFPSISGWYNPSAYVIAGTLINPNVRFGHDGSKCCIYIGELNTTWSCPCVFVTDFEAGHENTEQAKWDSGWSIGFETAAFLNVSQTIVAGLHATLLANTTPSATGLALLSAADVSAARTTLNTLGATYSGGYWGLTTPSGGAGAADYIRATLAGFLPSEPNASGRGYVGTATWPFLSMYAKNLYAQTSATINGRLLIDYNATGGDATWDKSGILIQNKHATSAECAVAFNNISTNTNTWITGLNQSADMKWAYGTAFSDAVTKMALDINGSLLVGANNNVAIPEKLTVDGNIAFGSTDGKARLIYNSTENSIDFVIN